MALRWLSAALFLLLAVTPACQTDDSEPPNDAALRILTYNVWYGFTIQPERQMAWRSWVAEQAPDIVSLQELNEYTDEKLQEDASSWGHDYSVLLKTEGFPTGLTSRYPIEETTRFLDGFHHGLMRVKTAGVYVYVVHLHPSNWETRVRETRMLLDDAAALPEDARIILAGDFNTFSPADSTHYNTRTRLDPFFSERDEQFGEQNLRDGTLDYTPLSLIAGAGFVDLEARYRDSFSGTFPTEIEKEGEHGDSRRLDFILSPQATAQFCQGARSISNPATARLSDHYPVIADFRFE